MSKNPVVIIQTPDTKTEIILQTKHIADVLREDNRVYLTPTHVHIEKVVLEYYQWKYASPEQAANVHKMIGQAMVKGCSVKIYASGDAVLQGKGS